jgi:cardiolipin synthase
MDAPLTVTVPAPPSSVEDVPPAQVTVAGNELTIYVESGPCIAAMVADIRAATGRVWLEIYILVNDAAGRAVADALSDRARAGLDVRLIYDAIGSQTTPAAYFRDMEQAGVQVHCFHSLWEAFWRFSFFRKLNRRNHRKLLVIDERVAYFGGMNIVDDAQVATGEQLPSLSASSGWRDVHVRMTGPQQGEVAESFDRSWRRAHGQKVPRRARSYRMGQLAAGEESIQFFDSGPGSKNTRAVRLFHRLFSMAKLRIALSMAYFLPVGRVLRALLKAHRRGVFIRVVVPGQSDVALVQRATTHLYAKLLRRRFHIYERLAQMLHSKVTVVDDEWSVLGSCNLDPRSLWINYEFLAVIHSRPLARALTEIIRYEIARSHRITLSECLARGRWQRFLDRVAWGLRSWL